MEKIIRVLIGLVGIVSVLIPFMFAIGFIITIKIFGLLILSVVGIALIITSIIE